MGEKASSAEPQALYRYADLARRSTDRLRQVTRRVDVALNGFVASCDGIAPLFDPHLTAKLRRYLDDLEPKDAWVRQVGRDFAAADTGNPQPLGQTSSHGYADTSNGHTTGNRRPGSIVGKPGGGAGRIARTPTSSDVPPPDDDPDAPPDASSIDNLGGLWNQDGVAGAFDVVVQGGQIRAMRGETWACRPDGPFQAAADGTGTGHPVSDIHFEATRVGDILDGTMNICWYDGVSPASWAPARVQLSIDGDGERMSGTWYDDVDRNSVDVSLTRVQLTQLTSEDFGLPPTNLRIFGYNVLKAHRNDGTIANVPEDYTLDPEIDAALVRHQGIDFTSRDEGWIVADLPFSTPVAGTVFVYANSSWNTIGLRLDTGEWLQFRHASDVRVSSDEHVEPGQILGTTGSVGTTTTHLHVEARLSNGVRLNPDLVVDQARPAAQPQSTSPDVDSGRTRTL